MRWLETNFVKKCDSPREFLKTGNESEGLCAPSSTIRLRDTDELQNLTEEVQNSYNKRRIWHKICLFVA